ncbi:MAG TPA: SDR family NAD(P)-dependent oxidoreductase [Candidatus Eisenbacteria bacterium]|nr:SDR family NAD(P)-dependent oxidoreductase [Candidatus Eisenbacteria bacterium]
MTEGPERRNDTVLVTGGTGAIGRVVVARFLASGYRVGVTYRSDPEWSALAAARSREATSGALVGVVSDVTREDSMREAVDRVAGSLGGLRVLVHVAGGYAGGVAVEAVEEDALRHMMELNLHSAFWAAKHVIPHAKRAGAGRLLFVSSRGAVVHSSGAAPYAAAKAGLNALVGTLAQELLATGVTANAVMPSMVDTPANRKEMPNADHASWVQPGEIAELLLFLASERASATSGALIPIYGRA